MDIDGDGEISFPEFDLKIGFLRFWGLETCKIGFLAVRSSF